MRRGTEKNFIDLKYLGEKVYYIELYYRSLSKPKKKLHTVFAIMPPEAQQLPKRLSRLRNQTMVNYRFDDLEEFVEELKRKQIAIDPILEGPDAKGIGKFTHLSDPEGNRIELWEPSSGT